MSLSFRQSNHSVRSLNNRITRLVEKELSFSLAEDFCIGMDRQAESSS